jgi:hypothetical protein
VICTQEVADTLARHVLQAYGQHYSLTLFFAGVSVLRPEKF